MKLTNGQLTALEKISSRYELSTLGRSGIQERTLDALEKAGLVQYRYAWGKRVTVKITQEGKSVLTEHAANNGEGGTHEAR